MDLITEHKRSLRVIIHALLVHLTLHCVKPLLPLKQKDVSIDVKKKNPLASGKAIPLSALQMP